MDAVRQQGHTGPSHWFSKAWYGACGINFPLSRDKTGIAGFLSALALLALSVSPAWAFDPKAALYQQEQAAERSLYERYRNKDLDKAKVNQDGTVTIGKLQWMRCSLGQKWNGNTCTGNASDYNQSDAKALPGLMNRQGGFAGHTDWRLPTIAELASLRVCSTGRGRAEITLDLSGGQTTFLQGVVNWLNKQSVKIGLPSGQTTFSHCSGYDNNPTIDARLFPNTPMAWFWSSSPYAYLAWAVGFTDGGVSSYSDYGRVRLVRTGQWF